MRSIRRIDSKGFIEFHQKRLDEKNLIANQKLQEEKRILKEKKERQKIEEEAKPLKSNWRSTLTESEWYSISGEGPTNSTGQTFAYGDPGSGIEVTLSGLGGVEAHPSTVTIDGETYDAPTYSQLAMQGYAKPLGFGVERRTDLQDVNPRLDASQEFAQAVGADYMMNARVDGDYYNSPEYKEYEKELERVNVENARRYAERDKKLDDFLKSFGVSADELINNRYAFIKDGKAYTFEGDRSDGVLYVHKQVSNAPGPLEFSIKPGEKNDQGVYFKLENSEVETKKTFKVNLLPLPEPPPYQSAQVPPDISPYLYPDGKPNMDALRNADAETFGKVFNYLKNKTPKTPTVLPDIDPEPEYDPKNYPMRFTFPRGNQNMPSSFPFDTSKLEKNYGEIASTDLIKGLILHSNPQTAIIPIATRVAKVLNIPAQWMIKLVAGDYTPITKSPGEFHNKQVFDIIRAKYKMLDIGTTTSKAAPKGAIPDDIYNRGMPSDYLTNFNMAAVRGSLGQFNYEVTPSGLKIKDTFNFGTNLNVGFLSDIPGTQQAANTLVAVSDQVARMKGLNPRDDKFGIPINYTIPWSQVPADLQNKLDPYKRIIPIRKTRQNESTTWDRIQKHR